jgi:transposase InsO family protein
VYQGVREHFGELEGGIAQGLVLRHDHGPQYMSHAFQQELRFLGIESSPSFIRAPQGNGVAERFIRTLKEQLLWVEIFDTVEELRQALLEFKDRFNRHWLLQRHGYATPDQVRAAHAPLAEAA